MRFYLVRVELGVMTMKGYSTFTKVPESEPHHQIVHWRTKTFFVGVLPLYSEAVSVLNNPG